jgi:ankyrin repeat protein
MSLTVDNILLVKYVNINGEFIPLDDYIKYNQTFLDMVNNNYPKSYTTVFNLAEYLNNNLYIDINIRNKDGNTFLHCCSDLDKLKYVLDQGANPNITNNNGLAPLNKYTNINKMELLLKYNIDKNKIFNNNYILANSKHTSETFKLLVQHGAILPLNNDLYNYIKYINTIDKFYTILQYNIISYTAFKNKLIQILDFSDGVLNTLNGRYYLPPSRFSSNIVYTESKFSKYLHKLNAAQKQILQFRANQWYQLLIVLQFRKHKLFNNQYLIKHIMSFV